MANPATSATHMRKRQFQPSISSYFDRGSDASTKRVTPSLVPALPADTQASLLNVGMRIRKSIPEGYKTHKTLSTTSFPFSSSAPPSTFPPVRPVYNQEHSRELAPFCGFHIVGGYAIQPGSHTHMPPSAPPRLHASATSVDDSLGVPALSTSQATLSSAQSSFAAHSSNPKASSTKRAYEDEIEDGMDEFFDDVEAEEQIMHTQARRMAKPRRSRRAVAMDERLIIVDDDFEEAAFLVPMDVNE